jgi:hypothetical protein
MKREPNPPAMAPPRVAAASWRRKAELRGGRLGEDDETEEADEQPEEADELPRPRTSPAARRWGRGGYRRRPPPPGPRPATSAPRAARSGCAGGGQAPAPTNTASLRASPESCPATTPRAASSAAGPAWAGATG